MLSQIDNAAAKVEYVCAAVWQKFRQKLYKIGNMSTREDRFTPGDCLKECVGMFVGRKIFRGPENCAYGSRNFFSCVRDQPT